MTLNTTERALFRCALWVAKVRGRISNTKLIVEVLKLALKLIEGLGDSIMQAGRKRVVTMSEAYGQPQGVFSWAPRVKRWLSDPNYVLYLGVLAVNP
jgi:hypothetical protein